MDRAREGLKQRRRMSLRRGWPRIVCRFSAPAVSGSADDITELGRRRWGSRAYLSGLSWQDCSIVNHLVCEVRDAAVVAVSSVHETYIRRPFSSREITSEVISSSVNLYNILVHIEYNVVPNFMLRKNNRKERGNRLLQTKTTNKQKTGVCLKRMLHSFK